MKNRIIKISILIIEIILLYIFGIKKIEIKCLFKEFLSIRCPGCGLTRAFNSIMHLNFIEATKYNILSIPLFISFIILTVLIIHDIIFDTNIIEKVLNFIKKHSLFIIILLILAAIINNINGI